MVVNETHSFKGTIVMYLYLMTGIPLMGLAIILWQRGTLGVEGPFVVLIAVLTINLAFLLIMSLQLRLRLDEYGLSYQNAPFQNRWKKIKKEDILSICVKKQQGTIPSMGLQYRIGRRESTFLFLSNDIIQVELANRRLIFSTGKPREIEAIIQNWKSQEN